LLKGSFLHSRRKRKRKAKVKSLRGVEKITDAEKEILNDCHRGEGGKVILNREKGCSHLENAGAGKHRISPGETE